MFIRGKVNYRDCWFVAFVVIIDEKKMSKLCVWIDETRKINLYKYLYVFFNPSDKGHFDV